MSKFCVTGHMQFRERDCLNMCASAHVEIDTVFVIDRSEDYNFFFPSPAQLVINHLNDAMP